MTMPAQNNHIPMIWWQVSWRSIDGIHVAQMPCSRKPNQKIKP
jgi:hypothetical protein